jgi:hypothetical protein
MKEWGEGILTKAETDYIKHKDFLIDKTGDYICTVCKKVWVPTINDVNQKRPSTYYRLCCACRLKAFNKGREYKKKNGNNFNALYDANSRTNAIFHEL